MRVLLLQDSPADTQLILGQLERAGLDAKTDLAATPAELFRALETAPYDVVLADATLLQPPGLEPLIWLQQHGLETPFILLTSNLGEDAAVELLKRGVSDCVSRDRLGRLPIALRRALREHKLAEDRRRTEQQLEHLNRLYSVLSHLTQVIVRTSDRGQLFADVCRVAVEEGPFRLAWFGMVDSDTGVVRPLAHYGFEDGYLAGIRISLSGGPESCGPTAMALRERRPFVVNDIAKDPRMLPWREAALARGYRSSAAFPVIVQGRLMGVFSFYAAETHLFGEEIVSLLDGVAADVAFALESLEREQQWLKSEQERLQLEAREQAARAQAKAEARFRELLEAAFLPIFEIDRQARIVLLNKAAETVFLYPRQELFGRPITLLIPDCPPLGSLSMPCSPGPMRGRRADGSQFPVEVSFSPVETEDRNLVTCIVRDLTEHERAEAERARLMAELERNLAQREAVFNSMTEGLIVADSSGRLLDINPAGLRMHGFEARSATPRSVEEFRAAFELYHLDSRLIPPPGWPLARALAGEFFSDFEVQVRRAESGQVWVGSFSGSAVRDRNGEVTLAVVTVRDITAQKQAEYWREQLTRGIIETQRALAAANQELELRNREVERANQLKSQFLASMSHELRTPLNAIIGFSDLLSEGRGGALSEKQLRFVGHIQKGARHLLELINDILDLSKIEAGRLDLHCEVFPVASALDEVLPAIRPLALDKRIQVESVADDTLVVSADRIRFKQILYNLLSNALKFTPEGGVIGVETAREGDFASLTVWDTGVGIPLDEQQAIFDEFYQVGTTTRGVKEGTGLGLAITRRLVEQHGGVIRVDSRPGHGSRFTVTIPLAAAAGA